MSSLEIWLPLIFSPTSQSWQENLKRQAEKAFRDLATKAMTFDFGKNE
jgi:hypothetical protein